MKTQQRSNPNHTQPANPWANILQAGLGEFFCQAVIRKAHLHPQMSAAFTGAGTDLFAANLSPRVGRVLILERAASHPGGAQIALDGLKNVIWMMVEGDALPVPDQTCDTVFANLQLGAAADAEHTLRELGRVLRPGGRLVLTGIEENRLRSWLDQAGLVNRIVEQIGTAAVDQPASGKQGSQLTLWVAVGARRVVGVEAAVRDEYAAAAQGGGSCCAPSTDGSCCGGDALISLESIGETPTRIEQIFATDYTQDETESIPRQAAEFSLGCGNPTAFAALQPGEVVLDIGSGGGLDALIAARQVGPGGKVIGVDMTPQMLERARAAAAAAGMGNVEFRQGQADALPVEAESVDVILSNCVINLTPDKGKVFQEAWRVLRQGGRLEVSDIVTDIAFLPEILSAGQAWSGCVTGALPEEEYVELIRQAGFNQVQVRRSEAASSGGVRVYSAQVSARKTTPGND